MNSYILHRDYMWETQGQDQTFTFFSWDKPNGAECYGTPIVVSHVQLSKETLEKKIQNDRTQYYISNSWRVFLEVFRALKGSR